MFHNGGKEYRGSFGYPIVLAFPVTKANGKLEANPGRTANGPYTSGMRVWITPPGKQPDQLRYLLKTKGIKNAQ